MSLSYLLMMSEPEQPFQHRKNVDLHESEWHHEKKREPILGFNGRFFVVFIPAVILIGWAVKTSFFWAKDSEGGYWALAAWGLFWVCVIWLWMEPVVNACYDLADWIVRKLRRQ